MTRFLKGAMAILFGGVLTVHAGTTAVKKEAVRSAPPKATSEKKDVGDLMDMSLEQLMEVKVTTTASRYEQETRTAPALITILTARDIRAHGWRTLEDLLKSAMGFYFSEDRDYNYIGVRGFSPPGDYNSRVLILLDGHRLNENIFDSVGYGWDFPVDMENIERVEIIRGPASVMYGSNALMAVVQVITKNARASQTVRLKGDYLGPESSRVYSSFQREMGSAGNLFVSLSRVNLRGAVDLYYPEYDDPATNDGIAERVDGESASRLFLKWSLKNWGLEGGASTRFKRIPTGGYETVFNDSGTFTKDEHAFGTLWWKKEGETWSVNAKTSMDAYLYKGDYLYSRDPLALNQDSSRGVWWTFDFQGLLKAQRNHSILYGFEYRREFRADQSNREGDVEYLDDHRRGGFGGAFLQDEWHFAPAWWLTGGVRYDNYIEMDSATSPRAALVWTPGSSAALKVTYGNAFRAPDVYERFYQDQGFSQKSPEFLRSEKVRNLEFIWEQTYGKGVGTDFCVFHYEAKDLIVITVDPADDLLVYVNQGRFRGTGGGLGFHLRGSQGRVVRLAYSYAYVRAFDPSGVPSNSPKHLGKVNWIEPLWGEKLLWGAEGQMVSKRDTISGAYVDPYGVVNATLSLADWPCKGWAAQVGMFNLFNRRYHDPVSDAHLQDSIAMDGRAVRLSFSTAF